MKTLRHAGISIGAFVFASLMSVPQVYAGAYTVHPGSACKAEKSPDAAFFIFEWNNLRIANTAPKVAVTCPLVRTNPYATYARVYVDVNHPSQIISFCGVYSTAYNTGNFIGGASYAISATGFYEYNFLLSGGQLNFWSTLNVRCEIPANVTIYSVALHEF